MSPVFKHSSHPFVWGCTSRISCMCAHCVMLFTPTADFGQAELIMLCGSLPTKIAAGRSPSKGRLAQKPSRAGLRSETRVVLPCARRERSIQVVMPDGSFGSLVCAVWLALRTKIATRVQDIRWCSARATEGKQRFPYGALGTSKCYLLLLTVVPETLANISIR